jgi:hypothetical protein
MPSADSETVLAKGLEFLIAADDERRNTVGPAARRSTSTFSR